MESENKGVELQTLIELYKKHEQGHVFANLDKLTEEERLNLINEAQQIDPAQINQLYRDLVIGSESQEGASKSVIEPVEMELISDRENLSEAEKLELSDIGYKKIREGKVTVVVLAGGQGTRLGSDRPKGEYNIGLPSGKSIFQILTERFLKAQMLAHGSPSLSEDQQQCKLLIMTSGLNHVQTQQFFRDNNYFGALP